MSWLSREALEMQWSAVIPLIYSWKGAFSIQEITNLIKHLVSQFDKKDIRVSYASVFRR